MPESQQLFPTETDRLVAGLAVRRDVQALAAAPGEPARLADAVQSTRLALIALSTTMLGADPAVVYRRLIEAIVAVEHVAVNTRVAYPDLEIAA